MSASKLPSIDILLRSLRLPTILREHETIAKTAEQEEWSYTKYLHALCEIEVMERSRRRVENNLKRSNLPDGKTMETFDISLMPIKIKRQVSMLLEGGFADKAENVLAFGLPGRGKSHLLCGIARELIVHKNKQVLYITAFSLVQKLLIAKRDLTIEMYLKKLDKFDVILLDDIGYVQQSREEMEILFTFLSERYERRSLMITSNLVFKEWDKIFKDPMTTSAAIDRLVHHSVILELNVVRSYRAEEAAKNQKKIKH
jgi:DNA replication protein DnaC